MEARAFLRHGLDGLAAMPFQFALKSIDLWAACGESVRVLALCLEAAEPEGQARRKSCRP
jgi:hypothetical protein